MRYPNFSEERKLQRRGCRMVFGIDEAGRGPLAGPVVAAAVFVGSDIKGFLKAIKDSKKLSSKKREELYNFLKNNPDIEWGIGRVSEKVIDKINILEATKLAMKRAVKNLEKKRSLTDYLIIDGNFKINLDIPQKSIVRADEKIFSCASASIIAKVTRDRIMMRQHKKYFKYGFDKHKGYPTKLHCQMLRKYGPCQIHRKSFGPVKEA